MHVTKILINKEEVEVEDGGYFSEFLFSPFMPVMLDDGQVLPPGQRYEIKYRVAFVESSLTGEKKYYGIRIGNEGIFQDLIKITDEQIKDKIDEAVTKDRKITRMAHVKATFETIRQIKKLPWYRRLFNKF